MYVCSIPMSVTPGTHFKALVFMFYVFPIHFKFQTNQNVPSFEVGGVCVFVSKEFVPFRKTGNKEEWGEKRERLIDGY